MCTHDTPATRARALLLATTLFLILLPARYAGAQSLGTAQSFGALAGSTVTNTGPTVVNGDVGVSPGSAVTGFPPGTVVGGTIHSADAVAAQAQFDLTTAYNEAANAPCTELLPADVGGLTRPPGVYCFATSAQITGTFTLDFMGNPDALFIFKVPSSLTTASSSSVAIINAGGETCPPNVFWQVGSSAVLGTGSSFTGNILALTSITLNTATSLNGRALARNGAVTLDSNVINACAPLVACAVITVTPATLPGGVVALPYNADVNATGGTPPHTFAVTSGALPPGLLLDPSTGVISGVPTLAGSFNYTITATEVATGCMGSRAYATAIAPAGSAAIPTVDFIGFAALAVLLAAGGMFFVGRS